MKFKSLFALIVLAAATAVSAKQQDYSIVESNGFAIISFTNNSANLFNGVGTFEGKSGRRWVPLENFFIVDQRVGRVVLRLPSDSYSDYRLRSVAIGPGGFKNLALAYGNIDTIAGNGVIPPPGTNAWVTNYEGASATEVPFSDPRAIAADDVGNIYVSEHDSHAISVISNGVIRTAIGTRHPGHIVDEFPIPAPFSPLNGPSGMWQVSGKLYILDNGNSRVVVYANGFLSTVFIDTNGIPNGNGLWVSPDGLEAFYTDGQKLKRWRSAVGVEVVGTNFIDLAAVTVDPAFNTIVADRGDNVVWHVSNSTGLREAVAGMRFPVGRKVGRATGVSLRGPSSLSYLPFGGYLVGLDDGANVWYVDSGGNAARLVFGAPGVHAGDGDWFQRGRTRPKISNVKAVTMEPYGDILILEGGYVRRINFLRRLP